VTPERAAAPPRAARDVLRILVRGRLAVTAVIVLVTVPAVDRTEVTPLLARGEPTTLVAQLRAAPGGETLATSRSGGE